MKLENQNQLIFEILKKYISTWRKTSFFNMFSGIVVLSRKRTKEHTKEHLLVWLVNGEVVSKRIQQFVHIYKQSQYFHLKSFLS